MIFFRTLFFWVLLIPFTVSYAAFSLLSFFIPFYIFRYRIITLWSYVFIFLAKYICGIRFEIIGKEHLKSVSTAIVASKHQSSWETFFLQTLLPPQSWVLKKQLLTIPFFGWALAMLKPIAIDRKARRSAMQQVLEQGKVHLNKGRWVIIFPEGTRVAPGKMGTFKKGFALLSSESQYPIIPIAHNAGCFWKENSFCKEPGTISVIIGAPIFPEGKTAEALLSETQQWVASQQPNIEAKSN